MVVGVLTKSVFIQMRGLRPFHARRLIVLNCLVLLTHRHYLSKFFEGGLFYPVFSREGHYCTILEHKKSIQAIFSTSLSPSSIVLELTGSKCYNSTEKVDGLLWCGL